MTTGPQKEEKKKEKKEESSSGLAPLLVWGSLIAIFGFAKLIAGDDKALGNQIFACGLGAWFIGLFISLIAGKNLKETKDNAVGFGYLVGVVIVGIVVLVLLSFLIPSSCSSDNSAPADIYYRK